MKKIVLFLSIQLVIFSSITMAASWQRVSSWAENEVISANNQELIPDVLNELDYTENISRKEFAAICVKLYEKLVSHTIEESRNNPFDDTEVATGQSTVAMEILKELPFVKEILQEGTCLLRVRTEGGEAEHMQMLREMTARGLPVTDFHRIPMNLEQVFMEVTQDE